MRCLIVDDDAICRKAVGVLLEEIANFDEAADGEEAVAKFGEALRHEEPYDVIFLDILMPGIDGHETASQIREIERGFPDQPKVKIVMVTILNSVNDAMASYLNVDSTAYLVKPASEGKFIDTFKTLGLL
jgi:two-component system, chemotaxis family, chemotaxis protein CheY